MVRESLARKFHPAGFEQPENSRKGYVKPRAELQYAFDRWVEELPTECFDWKDSEKRYKNACESIKPIGEISYREANSLLFDFEPKIEGHREVGLFISACYNQSSERVIVFDLDAHKIKYIGLGIGKGRILVNEGMTGKSFGVKCSGTIINNAYTEDFFGDLSSGIIVNNGLAARWFAVNSSGLAVNNLETGDYFAHDSSGFAVNNGECGNSFASCSSGIAVNNGGCGSEFAFFSSGLNMAVKEPKTGRWKENDRIIKPADLDEIPELKQYLEELGDITKTIKDEESAKRFLQRYGPEPKERIEQDIKEILRNGGFEV